MRRYALGVAAALAAWAALGPAPAQAGSGLRFEWASAEPPKAFTDAGKITFSFKLRGSGTRDMRVDIVRIGAERVRTVPLENVPTGRRYTLGWNGLNVMGKPAKRGPYAFKVRNANGERIRLKEVRGRRRVDLYPYKFPVRGRHSYGDGIGAPRDGHTHQGQDIFAACGTKLVAPRGGRVQYRGYQSAAGHYLVLDMWHTGVDAVFMHLKGSAYYARGQKLRTGKKLGLVGQSGNASGCHLHMEEWSAPGWYQGGHFLRSVTRHLKAWDRWS
jgi:murein DD-endopeptidase MepM/ murein hydrolase activator NlpD